jgi:hypothetical protein
VGRKCDDAVRGLVSEPKEIAIGIHSPSGGVCDVCGFDRSDHREAIAIEHLAYAIT